MTGFVIIVGLVLLTMAAVSEAIEMMKWIDEHSGRKSK